MTPPNNTKISFGVDDLELLYEFRALIGHGQQKAIFNALLKDLVRLLKSDKREIAIGLLCSGDLKIEEFSQRFIKYEREHNND